MHKDLDAMHFTRLSKYLRLKRAFRQITNILHRYGIIENPRNLRFRFTLCMQLFF